MQADSPAAAPVHQHLTAVIPGMGWDRLQYYYHCFLFYVDFLCTLCESLNA